MFTANNMTLFRVLSSYQNTDKEKDLYAHFIITGESEFGGTDYQITLADFYLGIDSAATSISTKDSLGALKDMKEVDLNNRDQLREILSFDPGKVVIKSWSLGAFRDKDSGKFFPEMTIAVENQKSLSVPSNPGYRSIPNMEE